MNEFLIESQFALTKSIVFVRIVFFFNTINYIIMYYMFYTPSLSVVTQRVNVPPPKFDYVISFQRELQMCHMSTK